MANKVLFLINGLGMGNIVRNISLINVIKEECDVVIGASGHAFTYLQNNNSDFNYQEFPQLNFKRGFAKHLVEYSRILKNIIKAVKPDLIILDSVYIPFSIDTPTAILRNEVKMDMPGSVKMLPSYLIEYLDNLYSKIKNKSAIELSFTPSDNQFSPILREDVINLKSTFADHAIAFSSGVHPISENLIKRIQTFLPVKVYHNRGDKVSPEFYRDLASSKVVICRGGFNSLSEALYLKKPAFIIPIKNHYEQYQNAKILHNLGLGELIEFEDEVDSQWINKTLNHWSSQKAQDSSSFKSSESDIWAKLRLLL